MLLTGDAYRESIRDGREVWLDGARVEDVTISFTPHERYHHQLEWREAAVAF